LILINSACDSKISANGLKIKEGNRPIRLIGLGFNPGNQYHDPYHFRDRDKGNTGRRLHSMKKSLLILLACTLGAGNAQGQQSYGAEIAAVAGIPTGKSADLYTTGFGVQGGFFFDLESNVRLGLVLGYIYFGLDQEALRKQYEQRGGTGALEASGGLGGIPILLSVRLITPSTSGPRFYGSLEMGLYVYRSSVSGTITDGAGNSAPIDNSEFRSEPGVALGLGGSLPVGENLYADLNVRYHFVRDSEFSLSGSANSAAIGTSQFLAFALGITYSFPL
jgi:opacity protein-like surface antigen